MLHQWFALNNPSCDDFAAIWAYLKLSISISGLKDSPVEITIDENFDDTDVIMPPNICPKYEQLEIHFFKGECLPKLDVDIISGVFCAKN